RKSKNEGVFWLELFPPRWPHRSRGFDGRVIPNALTLFRLCSTNPAYNEEASAVSRSKKNANQQCGIRAATAGHNIVIWMGALSPLPQPRARPSSVWNGLAMIQNRDFANANGRTGIR